MVFPVVMYGCESWTIKKAETRRIDAFEEDIGSLPEKELRILTEKMNQNLENKMELQIN